MRRDFSISRMCPGTSCGHRATSTVPRGARNRGKQTNCLEYTPNTTIQPGFSCSIDSAMTRAVWSSMACIADTSRFTPAVLVEGTSAVILTVPSPPPVRQDGLDM
jgi:hypothetical protein